MGAFRSHFTSTFDSNRKVCEYIHSKQQKESAKTLPHSYNI